MCAMCGKNPVSSNNTRYCDTCSSEYVRGITKGMYNRDGSLRTRVEDRSANPDRVVDHRISSPELGMVLRGNRDEIMAQLERMTSSYGQNATVKDVILGERGEK